VPISRDLKDLESVLAWCHRYPAKCAAIAKAGQDLAMDVVQQLEQDQRRAIQNYAVNWLRTCTA
jgi:hypothetical protein